MVFGNNDWLGNRENLDSVMDGLVGFAVGYN